MATLNKPENFKTIEAHDLGQISIKSLLDFIEEQADIIEQRLKTHISRVEEFELTAQIRQLDAITLFVMARTPQAPKRYVVVEHPGTDREFQVFAASTYRDCHLWMNRHYTDDHCPADIMVQLPDGTLSTEI